MESNLEIVKSWTGIAGSLASVIAIVAAAWWFLVTTKFKPRIQFDLDCKFFPLGQNADFLVAELQFIFENKGFVEHKLYNLNLSVHALESETALKRKERTNELVFKKRILEQISLVPEKYKFYFVRPGARQVITHIFTVPKDASVIRVTSSFDYVRSDKFPHTSRRIFRVST